jgi:hypothetical protein
MMDDLRLPSELGNDELTDAERWRFKGLRFRVECRTWHGAILMLRGSRVLYPVTASRGEVQELLCYTANSSVACMKKADYMVTCCLTNAASFLNCH